MTEASGGPFKGEKLTIIKIIDTFAFYGIDTLLIAALTALTVQLFKATFLKKVKKRLLTFLPFFMGTLYYAAYTAIINLSITPVLNDYLSILEHGLSVGAAATLLYVMYEQFVRGDVSATAAESVIITLIGGYVADQSVNSVAKLIAKSLSGDIAGDGVKKISDLIADHAAEGITERDVALLTKLIIETMARINA